MLYAYAYHPIREVTLRARLSGRLIDREGYKPHWRRSFVRSFGTRLIRSLSELGHEAADNIPEEILAFFPGLLR